MTAAYRYDRGSSLRSPRRNAQGALICDGASSRLGLMLYPDPSAPDGIRRELRLEQDVFAPESLASFEAVPIVDDHPPVPLNASNAGVYARGTVLGPGRRDGDYVAVSMVVTDATLIAKIEAGRQRELSVGYLIDFDPTPGIDPRWGAFSGRQLNIRADHVAVVAHGRAGSAASIRMDHALVQVDDDDVRVTPLQLADARRRIDEAARRAAGHPSGLSGRELMIARNRGLVSD